MTDTRRKPVHHRADGNRQPDDSGPSAAERRKIVDQLAELDAVRPGRITHERTGRADGIDHHAGRSRRRGSGGCDTGARQRRRRSQVRRRILADRWRRGQARHQDDGRTPLRAFVAGTHKHLGRRRQGPRHGRAVGRWPGRDGDAADLGIGLRLVEARRQVAVVVGGIQVGLRGKVSFARLANRGQRRRAQRPRRRRAPHAGRGRGVTELVERRRRERRALRAREHAVRRRGRTDRRPPRTRRRRPGERRDPTHRVQARTLAMHTTARYDERGGSVTASIGERSTAARPDAVARTPLGRRAGRLHAVAGSSLPALRTPSGDGRWRRRCGGQLRTAAAESAPASRTPPRSPRRRPGGFRSIQDGPARRLHEGVRIQRMSGILMTCRITTISSRPTS